MVGPSISQADRERFLRRLKIGFALLVGLSMALVTVSTGGSVLLALGAGVGATVVGGVLAEFTFPDSIAETPYEDTRDRGPKPGQRMQERREESEEQRAADADGQRQR
jgi:hypothetical protein